jgi:general secretion pathway protein D
MNTHTYWSAQAAHFLGEWPKRWCKPVVLFLATMVGFLFFGAQSGTAQEADATQEERIGPLKLRDVPIDQILEVLERWTGKTMLRPQALPSATVTLNLKESVTRPQAIRAIETLLSLNGVALTPLDEQFVKVTPLNAARSEAPELIEESTLGLPPSGRMASKLFKLKFLRVNEFIPQIAGLLNAAAGGPPALFDKANAVLITDSLSNLQRIETLMLQLDRSETSGLQPKFYNISYAKAGDVVSKLRTMLAGPLQTQMGPTTTYSADDRTNQVMLFSDPEQHAVFDQLIARLDVRSGQDTRTEIMYLKHAVAKDVASLLGQLISGQNAAARGNGQDPVRPNLASRSETSPPANHTPSPSEHPVTPAGVPAPAVATVGVAMELSNQFSSLLTILPEERSNALVVSGTVDDIRLISSMVDRIDVLLAQVRIEVVIAEVSLNDNASTGISALGLKIEGDKLVGFSAALPGLSARDGVITRPDGSNSVTGPWDLAAQITLASTPRKSNATILSVPNIITTHNREGKIFVGEQRPVISSYINDGGGNNSSGNGDGAGYRSTVSSKDIGIQLSVKPLIGPDGSVQLEIKQEVNDVLGEVTIDGNPQPRIGRRATESFVSAHSGEIIVLGGLQRTSQSRNSSRLGPLPIIGDILGARSKEKTRTDLVFFLRPTVLNNVPLDNAALLKQIERFPKDHREEVERALN